MESTTASPTTNPVPGFDPFLQAVTLLLPDGTPFNITMPEINTYASFGVQICMNFGSQLGASFITLVILLLLTKRENRRSPIFILTGLSLALSVIRSALQAVYFMGPFYNPYAYFAQDYTRVPRSAYHISLTAGAMTLLLQLSIELSLILQVHVVLVTASKVHRFWIMVATITIALLAIGMRFALTVINGLAVRAARNFSGYEWLASATTITTTISIFFFCVVFVAKLGLALWQRRKLGLRQFGPMQIIFIMGCQTLIVPGKPPSFPTSLFSIFQYTVFAPELGSVLLTLVAIFLPLSSIWATSSVDGRAQASRGPDAHHVMLQSYRSSDEAKISQTLTIDTSQGLPSPSKSLELNDIDIEAQEVKSARVTKDT